MNAAFHWRGQPSEVAESLKPSTMARKPNLAPKRLHKLSNKTPFGGAYSKAKPGEGK